MHLEVRPDLVLLAVLAWTLFNGGYSGIVWAFVGGLWMDVLSGGPMGVEPGIDGGGAGGGCGPQSPLSQ
ncbi:MAG: rod shape-determining protein MreD [Caldilineaceae bacterium]